MRISVNTLKKFNACDQQVSLFHSIYGTRTVDITAEACVALADKFSWTWAAQNLLSDSNYKVFCGMKAKAREKRGRAINAALSKRGKREDRLCETCNALSRALNGRHLGIDSLRDAAFRNVLSQHVDDMREIDAAYLKALARAFGSLAEAQK